MWKMKGIDRCAKFIVLTLSAVQALPIACKDDDHCPSGSYCSAQLLCHACLSCEDFKREPPLSSVPCISSITDCGSCLAGFVSDNRDVHCSQKLLLPYEWAIIGVSLLLAVVICALAVYVLRNFQTFKILATTRTSAAVVSYSQPTLAATAPDLPPSYNAVAALLPNQCEEAKPFIEPIRHESTETQDACVYNDPVNTQLAPPNSLYTPMLPEVLPPIPEDDGNISGSLSAELEDGGRNDPPASQATAVKLLPAQQDSNNNSEPSDEESGEKAQPTFFGHSGTSFIINVIRNVNSVQQRNDVMA